ncbi:MAG: hypothetical protein KJZ80_05125 [Hyphomicrobiaceae bacterium]|nr:hypothetical protein [Hyphomicrobiaceae bacterium]
MRFFGAGLLALALAFLAGPSAVAKPQPAIDDQFSSHERILQWIDGYRLEPEPDRLPDAVRALSRLGLFKDADTAGVFVGFMAGVLGSNPQKAESMVARMFPMPPEDQGAIIKAIAYSGLPGWKDLLGRFVERMPARKVLIDSFLFGKAKVLHDMPLDTGPAPIDTLWGYYFATGSHEPVYRIVGALAWSTDASDVNRLTIGSVAKWTLANNASRDKELLYLLRQEQRMSNHSAEVRTALKEIVEAAQSYETGKIRKDALAAIEELKRRGPQPNGTWAKAAHWGSTAIALGCVVAGATGQVALGLPCILTGALSSAAVKLLSAP